MSNAILQCALLLLFYTPGDMLMEELYLLPSKSVVSGPKMVNLLSFASLSPQLSTSNDPQTSNFKPQTFTFSTLRLFPASNPDQVHLTYAKRLALIGFS